MKFLWKIIKKVLQEFVQTLSVTGSGSYSDILVKVTSYHEV